ncbi:MAG: beta-glucosidase BglX [Mangrovibacterium sp.]
MRKIIVFLLFPVISCCSGGDAGSGGQNETERQVNDLLSRMTLEEKIGQMNQYTSRWEMTGPAPKGQGEQEMLNMIKNGQVGSMLNVNGAEATRRAQSLAVENSRLGIPLIFGYDVIHGYRTMFPIPLATAASWNPEAAEKSARVAAVEAAASGINWTFAPMVDIARDARWGRIMEGAGEDPYLGARMAEAQVRGFQGTDLRAENTVAACAKHFAAYGFAEAGRDYNTVEITKNTLQNIVLPPFKACVDAGVASVMNAFNEIGGIPATANGHLVCDILKGDWDFKGFVVSDWNSVGEIHDHGIAPDKKEAAYLAMKAGCDMDMEGNTYVSYLKELVKEGRIGEDLIDEAVRRILTVKFKLGLFDDPYRYCDPERENVLLSAEHLQASREVARQSIVLLKNEGELLPLRKEGQRIALIGDLADDKDSPLGSWRARALSGTAVSLLEGMRAAVADASVLSFARGPVYVSSAPEFTKHLEFNETDRSGIAEAVQLARHSDVVVLALGENCFQSGEGRSQTEIGLKGLQQELLDAVYAVNKKIVVVLMNGRPMAVPGMTGQVPAILEAWQLGSEAGNAIADVLFGDYNPSGKLPVSFPRSVGQCPLYYNHKSTGRSADTGTVFWSHYTDESNQPLFPFGFGLSYTTFAYEDLELSAGEMIPGDTLRVSVKLTNTGKYAGTEVVQLYLRDLFGSVTRPVRELKGFQRVWLEPGESRRVDFSLSEKDLAFFTADNRWETEPGDFRLWVGPDSQKGLQGAFILK